MGMGFVVWDKILKERVIFWFKKCYFLKIWMRVRILSFEKLLVDLKCYFSDKIYWENVYIGVVIVYDRFE